MYKKNSHTICTLDVIHNKEFEPYLLSNGFYKIQETFKYTGTVGKDNAHCKNLIFWDVYGNFNVPLVRNNKIMHLYTMLLERDPICNISHKNMPTMIQHKKFVDSKPYKLWYIIREIRNDIQSHVVVGNSYLTNNNEIGIFINKDSQNKGFGDVALKTMIKFSNSAFKIKTFFANIAPLNEGSKKFFIKHGFKKIHDTYRKDV